MAEGAAVAIPSSWFRRHRASLVRAVAVLLVLGLCAHFLRGIAWQSVSHALASASLPLLLLAGALNLVQVGIRAFADKVLLLPVCRISTLRLARYNLGMYAGNNLLPGRAGELIRIQLLRAREGVPTAATVAVALVEKVFDLIALLLLVLPLPFLMPGLPQSVWAATLVLGLVGVFTLGLAFFVSRFAGEGGHFQRFAAGASVVRRADLFAGAVAVTLAAWLLDAAEVTVCLRAVGIAVPAAAPLLILLAIAGAVSVPSTPANVGALELGAVAALHLLGVDEASALAFGLAYHLIQIVPTTLLGLDGIRLAGELTGASPRS